MQALMFNTKILENGIIKIQELSNWYDYEVSVFIVRKEKQVSENIDIEPSKILAEFHKVRQIKTGTSDKLTLENSINIYDELTNIH